MTVNTEWLILILTGVVCGCCLLLCLAVVYLCVRMKRMRRDIENLQDKPVYTDASAGTAKNKAKTTKRLSSVGRYAPDPSGRFTLGLVRLGDGSAERPPSAITPDPGETVTYLRGRDEHPPMPEFENTEESPGQNTSELVTFHTAHTNDAFSNDNEGNSSDEIEQPIYTNQEAIELQPIYTNESELYQNTAAESSTDEIDRTDSDVVNEPIYMNKGELAEEHNPEWDMTMTISKVS